jgi:hypothetical protein
MYRQSDCPQHLNANLKVTLDRMAAARSRNLGQYNLILINFPPSDSTTLLSLCHLQAQDHCDFSEFTSGLVKKTPDP